MVSKSNQQISRGRNLLFFCAFPPPPSRGNIQRSLYLPAGGWRHQCIPYHQTNCSPCFLPTLRCLLPSIFTASWCKSVAVYKHSLFSLTASQFFSVWTHHDLATISLEMAIRVLLNPLLPSLCHNECACVTVCFCWSIPGTDPKVASVDCR